MGTNKLALLALTRKDYVLIKVEKQRASIEGYHLVNGLLVPKAKKNRSGSRARKAKKAAIAARAALIKPCVGSMGTSAMYYKRLEAKSHHATAWNAPSGAGHNGPAKVQRTKRWAEN